MTNSIGSLISASEMRKGDIVRLHFSSPDPHGYYRDNTVGEITDALVYLWRPYIYCLDGIPAQYCEKYPLGRPDNRKLWVLLSRI